MASILDEYEDSLSRSAVLQPGCPSVGIPHSGKGGEGAAHTTRTPGTCGGGSGRVAPRGRFTVQAQALDSPQAFLAPSWWMVEV